MQRAATNANSTHDRARIEALQHVHSLGKNIASTAKQLTLRTIAGHPPTTHQLEKLDHIELKLAVELENLSRLRTNAQKPLPDQMLLPIVAPTKRAPWQPRDATPD